jgi:hypothetical protein
MHTATGPRDCRLAQPPVRTPVEVQDDEAAGIPTSDDPDIRLGIDPEPLLYIASRRPLLAKPFPREGSVDSLQQTEVRLLPSRLKRQQREPQLLDVPKSQIARLLAHRYHPRHRLLIAEDSVTVERAVLGCTGRLVAARRSLSCEIISTVRLLVGLKRRHSRDTVGRTQSGRSERTKPGGLQAVVFTTAAARKRARSLTRAGNWYRLTTASRVISAYGQPMFKQTA